MYHSIQRIDHNLKYFMEYNSVTPNKEYIHHRQININTHHTKTLFNFNISVKITPKNGLALLLLKDPEQDMFHTLLIESDIYLNKNIPFNILSLSPEASVDIATQVKQDPSYIKLASEFSVKKLTRKFNIEQISALTTTTYQEEYYANFVPHTHFELLIIENGEMTIILNNEKISLNKGQLIIVPQNAKSIRMHSANQRTLTHSIHFEAPFLDFRLLARKLDVSHLIAPIIDALHQNSEEILALDNLYLQLNSLIYSLYQQLYIVKKDASSTAMREKYENDIFNEIIQYIHESDIIALKVSNLVDEFNLSRSTLQQLFNKYEHTTPKIYINQLRLEKSRQLIRESNLSITEIATKLGYGSIQYFSRAFSKAFNVSPSEYAKGYAKRI